MGAKKARKNHGENAEKPETTPCIRLVPARCVFYKTVDKIWSFSRSRSLACKRILFFLSKTHRKFSVYTIDRHLNLMVYRGALLVTLRLRVFTRDHIVYETMCL